MAMVAALSDSDRCNLERGRDSATGVQTTTYISSSASTASPSPSPVPLTFPHHPRSTMPDSQPPRYRLKTVRRGPLPAQKPLPSSEAMNAVAIAAAVQPPPKSQLNTKNLKLPILSPLDRLSHALEAAQAGQPPTPETPAFNLSPTSPTTPLAPLTPPPSASLILSPALRVSLDASIVCPSPSSSSSPSTPSPLSQSQGMWRMNAARRVPSNTNIRPRRAPAGPRPLPARPRAASIGVGISASSTRYSSDVEIEVHPSRDSTLGTAVTVSGEWPEEDINRVWEWRERKRGHVANSSSKNRPDKLTPPPPEYSEYDVAASPDVLLPEVSPLRIAKRGHTWSPNSPPNAEFSSPHPTRGIESAPTSPCTQAEWVEQSVWDDDSDDEKDQRSATESPHSRLKSRLGKVKKALRSSASLPGLRNRLSAADPDQQSSSSPSSVVSSSPISISPMMTPRHSIESLALVSSPEPIPSLRARQSASGPSPSHHSHSLRLFTGDASANGRSPLSPIPATPSEYIESPWADENAPPVPPLPNSLSKPETMTVENDPQEEKVKSDDEIPESPLTPQTPVSPEVSHPPSFLWAMSKPFVLPPPPGIAPPPPPDVPPSAFKELKTAEARPPSMPLPPTPLPPLLSSAFAPTRLRSASKSKESVETKETSKPLKIDAGTSRAELERSIAKLEAYAPSPSADMVPVPTPVPATIVRTQPRQSEDCPQPVASSSKVTLDNEISGSKKSLDSMQDRPLPAPPRTIVKNQSVASFATSSSPSSSPSSPSLLSVPNSSPRNHVYPITLPSTSSSTIASTSSSVSLSRSDSVEEKVKAEDPAVTAAAIQQLQKAIGINLEGVNLDKTLPKRPPSIALLPAFDFEAPNKRRGSMAWRELPIRNASLGKPSAGDESVNDSKSAVLVPLQPNRGPSELTGGVIILEDEIMEQPPAVGRSVKSFIHVSPAQQFANKQKMRRLFKSLRGARDRM